MILTESSSNKKSSQITIYNSLLFIVILFSMPIDLVVDVNIRKVVVGGCIVLFLALQKRAFLKKYSYIFLLVFFYVFYTSFPGKHGFSSWVNYSYLSLFFFFLKQDEIESSFLMMKKILGLMFLIGLMSYILVVLQLIPPLGEVNNSIRDSQYDVYPFFLLENRSYLHPLYSVAHLFRFNSIFDEPGVVGTFSALILACKPLGEKYSFEDYILLIAGLISFSLAFYVLMGIYFLINFRLNSKCLSVLLVVAGFLIVFNKPLDAVIFNRMEYSGGKFEGDNRVAEDFEQEFSRFLESSDIFFGMGNAAHQKFPGSSTYLSIMYNYGIFGFVLYMSIFIAFLSLFPGKRKYLFMSLFLINIYQRPYTLDITTFLILYMGLYLYSVNYKKRTNDISHNTSLQ